MKSLEFQLFLRAIDSLEELMIVSSIPYLRLANQSCKRKHIEVIKIYKKNMQVSAPGFTLGLLHLHGVKQ